LTRWIFWPERLVKFAAVCWILFSIGKPVYERWENRGAPPGPLDGLYEVAEFVKDGAVVPALATDATRWRHVFLSRSPRDAGQEIAQLAMSDGKTRAFHQMSVDTAQSTVTLTQPMRPGTEAQAPAPIVLKYRREAPNAAGKPAAAEAAAPADGPRAVEAPAKPEQGKTTEPTAAPAAAPTTAPTPAPTTPPAAAPTTAPAAAPTTAPASAPAAAPAPAAATEPALLVLEGTYNGAAITVRLRALPGDSFLLRNRGFHWITEYPFNR
jgi:hypothetical protein